MAVLAAASGGAPAHAGNDLVAPPISLSRLRLLLDDFVSPPPSPGEMAIVVATHRDMAGAYGASGPDGSGDRWRLGNERYDDLRFMRKDPTRARMREAVQLHGRMLADADAAERAMFESIAAALAADEPDEARKALVRDAVARAALAREVDRLLASLPMQEPSGVTRGMREAISRMPLAPDEHSRARDVLAARDAQLVQLLRREIRDYHAFAIAAAGAFEEVFGGVLPKIGAAFSEEEQQRLRARMVERCADEGARFLATRNELRAAEDAWLERLCTGLSPGMQYELRLRTAPWTPGSLGTGHEVLSTEGHLRDALRELPPDDPVHLAVQSIAERWRQAVIERIAIDRARLREREDRSFWEPGVLRSLTLEFGDPSEGWRRRVKPGGSDANAPESLQAELVQVLGPRIEAAGGALGTMRVNRFGDTYVLVERASLGEWRREMADAAPRDPDPATMIHLLTRFGDLTDRMEPSVQEAVGATRRGIPRRMDRDAAEARVRTRLGAADAAIVLACLSEAWKVHEVRWDGEVEAAIPKLAEARARLVGGPASVEVGQRLALLNQAHAIRDTAWRTAESIDETFFAAVAACIPEGLAVAREAITLERLRRSTEREVMSRDVGALTRSGVREHPQWDDIVADAGLAPEAAVRVRSAMAAVAGRTMDAAAGRRRAAFDLAEAMDGWVAKGDEARGLPRLETQREAARAANAAADRAQVAMMAAMLKAAEDGADEAHGAAQRARLEAAILRGSFRGWWVDGSARRTGALALRCCTNDGERQEVQRALDQHAAACRMLNERRARLAVAIALADAGVQDLFPLPAEVSTAGSAERLDARHEREFDDLRSALEIELLGILGRDRWAMVAPPDLLELLGAVGGR